jgi:hypothetical protein
MAQSSLASLSSAFEFETKYCRVLVLARTLYCSYTSNLLGTKMCPPVVLCSQQQHPLRCCYNWQCGLLVRLVTFLEHYCSNCREQFCHELTVAQNVKRLSRFNFTTFPVPIFIYLLTKIGLSPGGSSTVHIYTQTIHRTTQITTNLEECGPCPVFASFTLTFALQLRKKHGKISVRVTKTPTNYKTHTHTHYKTI